MSRSELEARLLVLEARYAFEDLTDPGPDATDFEKQAYRIRQSAQSRGEIMSQQEAERIARQFQAAVEEIDRLTCGEAVEEP